MSPKKRFSVEEARFAVRYVNRAGDVRFVCDTSGQVAFYGTWAYARGVARSHNETSKDHGRRLRFKAVRASVSVSFVE